MIFVNFYLSFVASITWKKCAIKERTLAVPVSTAMLLLRDFYIALLVNYFLFCPLHPIFTRHSYESNRSMIFLWWDLPFNCYLSTLYFQKVFKKSVWVTAMSIDTNKWHINIFLGLLANIKNRISRNIIETSLPIRVPAFSEIASKYINALLVK